MKVLGSLEAPQGGTIFFDKIFIMRVGLSWLRILEDLVHFLCLGLRSRTSLAAENLFLRKQLAFYQERKVKPRRADNPTRLTLVLLSP